MMPISSSERNLQVSTASVLALLITVPSIGLLCSPYPFLAPAPGVIAVGAYFAVRYTSLVYAAIVLMIPFGAFRGPLQKVLAFALLVLIVVQCVISRRLPAR